MKFDLWCFIVLLITLSSCKSNRNEVVTFSEKIPDSNVKIAKIDTLNSISNKDYYPVINRYLASRQIKPLLTLNVENEEDSRKKFDFLGHQISWKPLEKAKGIELIINQRTIKTTGILTQNLIFADRQDNIDFADCLDQIRYYEINNYPFFILKLISSPCVGRGCNVSYQVIYDQKRDQVSYFGTFRSRYEPNFYNFNADGRIDYLSQTYHEAMESGIDTMEAVLYSKDQTGKFEVFSNKKQNKYDFHHIYSRQTKEFPEEFNESWVTKINRRNL